MIEKEKSHREPLAVPFRLLRDHVIMHRSRAILWLMGIDRNGKWDYDTTACE